MQNTGVSYLKMIVQKCHFNYFCNHSCLVHSVSVNLTVSIQNSVHGDRVNSVSVTKIISAAKRLGRCRLSFG